METPAYGYDDARRATDIVTDKLREAGVEPEQVNVGVILGSGLGGFANNQLTSAVEIPYNEIFRELERPEISGGVKGHAKKLVIGQLDGAEEFVIAQAGREHLYEDVDPKRATFWLRIMQLLGVKTLIGSNAAGIVTPHTLNPGDVMTVMDDIDDTGISALTGPNDERFGERFPHRADYYPQHVRELIQAVAREQHDGWEIKDGIYFRKPGPSYESPAQVYEMRARLEGIHLQGRNQPGDTKRWQTLGEVGTVGMSSTYEREVARHAELSETHPAFKQGVGYLSVATNYSASLGSKGIEVPSNPSELTEKAGSIQDRVGALVANVIREFEKQRLSS